MKLTEKQANVIIDDIVSKLKEVISQPCNGDYSNLECYEDDEGHCYNFGTYCYEDELEEICINGFPGIDPDISDIFISAKYNVDMSFHDSYEPGDYWTPPSGGIEIDEVNAYVSEITIEIDIFNQETDKYEHIAVLPEMKAYIIKKVNEMICLS